MRRQYAHLDYRSFPCSYISTYMPTLASQRLLSVRRRTRMSIMDSAHVSTYQRIQYAHVNNGQCLCIDLPAYIVRIVRASHGVETVTLHQYDIPAWPRTYTKLHAYLDAKETSPAICQIMQCVCVQYAMHASTQTLCHSPYHVLFTDHLPTSVVPLMSVDTPHHDRSVVV